MFNLKKVAKKTGFKNYNKMLEDQSNERGWTAPKESKNVNLSLDTKDKDNTIPYEKQIETNRKGKDTLKITEKALDTEPKVYLDKRLDKKRGNVMDINLATEVHNQKFLKAFEAMEDKDKRDTLFWDKYVGVQLLGDESIERTKVDNNISNSQLENCPDRFTSLGKDTTVFDVLDKDVKKMVTASIKDADAMLFHIYRSAAVQDRKLTGTEQQMVNDIEIGKINVLGQVLKEKYKYFTDKDFGNMFGRRPKKEKPNVIEGLGDPKSYNVSDDDIIIKAEGGVAVVYNQGDEIDRFASVNEATQNYPEARLI